MKKNTGEGIRQMIEYPKSGILSKDISSEDKIDSTLFCMAKGTKMSEHTSTKEGIFYVLDGKGTFNLSGARHDMVPGAIIHMDKNAVHSLKADENTSFVLFLFD
ncbi:cupin [Candidatus Woesearchaeota archaeon CG10_big_fil_rev_8_21_14_0_10_44_13]|nr:MAG: cupin [Candidatus Woesearchaeota archaeon CG10_big_fil_rev_8_21_14_0_10_44_13]